MQSQIPARLRSARLRPGRFVGLLTALALLLAGCGGRPLSTMEPESDIARDLDTLLMGLLVACAVILVLVMGVVIYMSVKFRVDAPEDEDDVYPDEDFPEQVHGNTRLEIGWTILPTIIMVIVGFFSMVVLLDLNEVEAASPRIHEVTVVGQQWWWEFQYHLDDDGVPDIVTAGEMALPVGEEVRLRITSRDVIHSFWVPRLNGKRDAVPGLTTPWTMQATAVGRYPGECTEFCGLSHAYMEKWVIGLEPADWDTWAANQMAPAEVPAEGTDAAAGYEVFQNHCASCHILNGLTQRDPEAPIDSAAIYDGANRLIDTSTQVAGAAPNLTHVASRSTFAGGIYDLYENPDSVPYLDLASRGDLNRGALEAWIRNAPELKANGVDLLEGFPRGMTSFESLSAQDIDNLVEFLITLD